MELRIGPGVPTPPRRRLAGLGGVLFAALVDTAAASLGAAAVLLALHLAR